MDKKVKFAVTDKACQILTESQVSNSRISASEPFRILSVGCGDGIFDAIILQAMISKHPDIKLDYLGIDIDEDTCQKARKELSVLKKTSDKVEIRILKMDMYSLMAEISASCDLVLAIQSLYYAIDLRKVLTDVHALLKTDGCMLIILGSQDYPAPYYQEYMYSWYYPFCHFWLHEHSWPIKLSDVTEESPDALGIKYNTKVICAELDLTECFRDGFQKPHQKILLDFITHTRLERYPSAVSQLCIEFLGSIAIGQSKEYVIPICTAFIACKNEY